MVRGSMLKAVAVDLFTKMSETAKLLNEADLITFSLALYHASKKVPYKSSL